jgi:uncharacterized protein
MKKNKLLLWSMILLFVMGSISIGFADIKMPVPTNAFYVGDFAGLLSDEAESFIISTNLNYEKTEEKPQVVVVTVQNLGGLDVESYAVRLFEEWKIGNAKYDNGVLLLIGLEERRVQIEVGYGLEGAIPDGTVGEILDTVTGDFSAGNYSEGLTKAFYLIGQEVNREYNYDDNSIFGEQANINIPKPSGGTGQSNVVTVPPIFKILGIVFVLLLIWLDYRFLGGLILGLLLRSFLYGGRGGGGGGFGGGSSGGGGRSGGGGGGRGF